MATAVTNETLVLNTVNPISTTAATADTADLAEVFTFTPSVFGNKYIIEINNVSASNGTVTYSLAAGAAWAGSAALTGSVAQGIRSQLVVETGKYLSSSGTLSLTITPASGKKLKTDHTLTVCGIHAP